MTSGASNIRPALLFVLAWGTLSVLISARGLYYNAPDQLPITLMTAVALPPILFGFAYRLSADLRNYVLGLDLTFLTALQGWRIIGAMFLVLMGYRLVPETFAWPAGVGDMIVGIYAPFVVLALVRKSPSWRSHVILLNILGLLDFVGAIGTGVLTGNNPLAVFHEDVSTDLFLHLPLSIIPTFAVPAWIILHIISLLQVGRTTEEVVTLHTA
jgi:hypothetical protein